jgi:hypothetical protein
MIIVGHARMITSIVLSCAFFRLKRRLPVLGNCSDDRTLCLIRRANLDAFWSRKRGTVRQQLGIFKEQVAIGNRHAITMTPPRGPFPLTTISVYGWLSVFLRSH